jgi:hypothetical protein
MASAPRLARSPRPDLDDRNRQTVRVLLVIVLVLVVATILVGIRW